MPFPDANADEEDEIGGPGRIKRRIAAGINALRNTLGVGPARANRPRRARPPRPKRARPTRTRNRRN